MNTPSPAGDLSLPQRIYGVFTAPRVVFSYLRDKPHFLGILLVLIVLHGVGGILIQDVVVTQQREQMEEQGGMTEDQIDSMASIVRILSPISMIVFTLLFLVVSAAILLFVSNVLLGGSTNFRTLFSGLGHVSMISIPALLVRVPLTLIRGDLEVQTSLTAFLPDGTEKGLLYAALSQLEVFALWQLGLSVLAVSVLAQIPVKRAAVGVIGIWFLFFLAWTPISVRFM